MSANSKIAFPIFYTKPNNAITLQNFDSGRNQYLQIINHAKNLTCMRRTARFDISAPFLRSWISTGFVSSVLALSLFSITLKPKNSMADGIWPTGIVPSGASLSNINLARFLNASISACLCGEAFPGLFARGTLDSGAVILFFLPIILLWGDFLVRTVLRDRARDRARGRGDFDAISRNRQKYA